jgi:subtilisin-like proprotein convertase family protein
MFPRNRKSSRLLLSILLLNIVACCFHSVSAQERRAARIAEEAVPVLTAVEVKPNAKNAVAPRKVNENVTPAVAASFTNPATITINDNSVASLYPSNITVVDQTGVVQRVSVTLNNLTHTFASSLDILLVSPSGRKSLIMSDMVNGAVNNVTFTLDDYAPLPLPFNQTGTTGFPLTPGAYRPTNSGVGDPFPAPAPAAPYTATLSAFNGDNPNGTWSLYVLDDDALGDSGSIAGGWTISFDARPPVPAPGQILVNEFRARGVGTSPPSSIGGADEFFELYNNTDSSVTIIDAIPGADPTLPAGAGWYVGIAQGASQVAFIPLPQTLSTGGPLAIPPRGFLLFTTQPQTPSPAGNTYSLGTYPSGTGVTASGAPNFTISPASPVNGFLPDAVGIAVFSTNSTAPPYRLDSVGFSSITHPDFKEGTGLVPPGGITTPSQHSWARKLNSGLPQDTGVNADDFVLVETTGAILDGVQATLGAPSPERGPTPTVYTTSGAPIQRNANIKAQLIDPQCAGFGTPSSACARVRTANGANSTNAAFGTLLIRRRFTNNTGVPVYALRFRVTDITTLGNTTNAQADLRLLSSTARSVTNTASANVDLVALSLQQPPTQTAGGGLHSSVGVTTVNTTVPLAAGATADLEFTLGVMRDGPFRFLVNVEALPAPLGPSQTIVVSGGAARRKTSGTKQAGKLRQ